MGMQVHELHCAFGTTGLPPRRAYSETRPSGLWEVWQGGGGWLRDVTTRDGRVVAWREQR